MNNIRDDSRYTCSGCGACHAVCPVNAIKLTRNDYGFYEAVVDEDLCISCGQCKEVCTRYDETVTGNSLLNSDLFALKSSERSMVMSSSSGGMASELAKYGISNGFKVTGVCYDLEQNNASHKTVSVAEELNAFAGSKYLQSNTSCFRETVKEKGFVFGTPCQIVGLHKVLANRGIRDDFILVEIFCHGVPSYKLWEEEIRRIKNRLCADHFDDLKFRHKKDDWHTYCIRAEKNGKVYFGERENDYFWQVYFEDMVLSEACYDCRFRKETSFADIRIGDYWGKKHSDDSEGVSAVFCLTEKGKQIINGLIREGKVTELEKTSNEEMLRYQNMRGYDQSDLHHETLEILKNNDEIDKAVKFYRNKLPLKKKIKGTLLRASGFIPSSLRYKIKKSI